MDMNQTTTATPKLMTGDATKNGKAVTSLVLGIVGVITAFIPSGVGAILTFIVAIIGIIFGIKGLKSLKRGIAIAGIVLCSLVLLAFMLGVLSNIYLDTTGQ